MKKNQCQIRKRVNAFISKATEVCQEEDEIESDIDLSFIESPMPDLCSKESLNQLIEKQFKTKVDYADIFKGSRPETLNLEEMFSETNE